MKQHKVLYLASTLKRAGPTNQLLNIIDNLDKDRFTPLILTLSPEPKESMLSIFKSKGIEVTSLDLPRIKGMLLGPKKVAQLINKISPSIIHSQGIRSDQLSATFFNSYKRIATIRNYPYHDYVMTYGMIKGKIMAWQHLQALKGIDQPVACSYSIAKLIKDNTGLELATVQNGVDTKRFTIAGQAEKESIRKILGLPQGKNIVISVGHLSGRKDPLTVINGFLKSRIALEGYLLFVGDGPIRSECEEMSKGYTNIKFTGRVSNVDQYLRASDLFISASKAEGLPNTVIEALASGLPVCLSNIGPHQEILSLNPKAGLLFRTGNPDDLRVKIDQWVNNDQSVTIQAALDIINQHLSAISMSKKYMNLYHKLVSS